jgi:hypothetical protein
MLPAMKMLLRLIACFLISTNAISAPPAVQYFQLTVYEYQSSAQEEMIEKYLREALIPALRRQGMNRIGVFKAISNDTASVKKLYVLINAKSLDAFEKTQRRLRTDNSFVTTGAEYINAAHNSPPYSRMQVIMLKAFSHFPGVASPKLKSQKSERVYELRSYESATEKQFVNKVHMFNEGGEVKLFDRLGFNAVFYAEVLAGARMPNLMYMTSFENKEDRDAHWKTFVDDAEWKVLSKKPEYQNNVSKIEISFLRPTEYSDL